MASAIMMYGCGACKERFSTREEMKLHFATPYHAYNAERKAKGFAPVDFATYKALEPDEEAESDRTPKFYCKICNKYYKSVQTLTMHIKSNQHIANKQKAIEDGASTVHSTASKFLLGSKYVSSKPKPKSKPGADGDPSVPAEDITPTPVLLLKDVPTDMTEADVHNVFEPWGVVHRVLLVKNRNQVLVQMPTMAMASAVLAGCPEGSLTFKDITLPIQYSARETLGKECNWCHQLGHTEDHCFTRARSCLYCKQEGHKKIHCPKLPCVACTSSTHTLPECEHRGHYQAVKDEIRKLTHDLHKIVEDSKDAKQGDAASVTAAPAPPADEASADAAAEVYKQRDWLQSCSCLFCDTVLLTPEEAANHMLQSHSFQLPMADLLEDLYGMMSFLQRKVGRACACGAAKRPSISRTSKPCGSI